MIVILFTDLIGSKLVLKLQVRKLSLNQKPKTLQFDLSDLIRLEKNSCMLPFHNRFLKNYNHIMIITIIIITNSS